MSLMTWARKGRVSHGTLEHDDRQFVELQKLLHSALSDDDTAFSLRVAQMMVREITAHFAREERLFAEYAYPGRDRHREGHAMMMRALKALCRVLEQDGCAAAFDRLTEVERVFNTRLAEDDDAFHGYLDGKGIVIDLGEAAPGTPT